MPSYEFKCPNCGETDELESKMDLIDFRVLFCKDCEVEMKRTFSAPGIIFKGSGWAGKS